MRDMTTSAIACEMTVTIDSQGRRMLCVHTSLDGIADHTWRSCRALAAASSCERVLLTYQGPDSAEPLTLLWEPLLAPVAAVRTR